MASHKAGAILQHLSKLVDERAAAQLTDSELLQRFSAHRDEVAFAALVRRHGGLVYGVCRNILQHEHDAEDVFQGTFLVLARQAASIHKQTAVGSWLYQVAFRMAVRARKATARCRQQETQAARAPADNPSSELSWRELQAILDEELNRLPEKYRAPFVLCCLEGKSKPEAATDLGWKEGTVSSRLAHARKLLQVRLARRGVTLSAVLTGLAVAQKTGAAAIPAALLAATPKAALAFATGETLAVGTASVTAVALARTVLRTMAFTRLAVPAAILTLVCLIGGAAALAIPPRPEAPKLTAGAVVTPPPKPAQAPVQKPASGRVRRMTVDGRVLGPDNNPLPGVRVAVVAAQYRLPGEPHLPAGLNMQVLGEGRPDEQGQFRLAVPQTTATHYRLTVLATAPGYALGCRMVDPARVTADEHTVPLQLVAARDVRGRLVDLQGAPAAGVRLHVLGVSRSDPAGVFFQFAEAPVRLPGWPESTITDAEGHFILRGLAPGTSATLQAHDERYATQWLTLTATQAGKAQPSVLSLQPARTLEGRLTAADTGLPLDNVTVVVEGRPDTGSTMFGQVVAQTDAQGRYRARPFPGKYYEMWAYPPDDLPYLVTSKRMQWPAGAARHTADLSLPRGILVRGTVSEEGSGLRVGGATIQYTGLGIDRSAPGDPKARWSTRVAHSGADGTFVLALPPGAGHLLAKAAEPDYVHVEVDSGRLLDGRKGGRPHFPDALVPLQLKASKESQHVAVPLRRGVTLRGRVVGSDGTPVASGWLIAQSYVPFGQEFKGNTLPVRDGRFEVPGCDSGQKMSLWIHDSQKLEGALVQLAAGAGAEPVVRLAPCTSARVRFLDPARKLIARPRVMAELVIRPGDDENDSLQHGTRARLSVRAAQLHGRGYERIDARGKVTLPYLIPGATYLIRAEERLGWPERLVFTAPQTGTLELQDIVTEPRSPSGGN